MPTVASHIKPVAVFPRPKGILPAKIVRAYPAEEWEQHGGREGMYRVMVGDKWVATKGRYTFLTAAEVAEHVGEQKLSALGIAPGTTPEPVAEMVPDLSRTRVVTVRGEYQQQHDPDWLMEQDSETLAALQPEETTMYSVTSPIFRHYKDGLCVFIKAHGGTVTRRISVHKLLPSQGKPFDQIPWEDQ